MYSTNECSRLIALTQGHAGAEALGSSTIIQFRFQATPPPLPPAPTPAFFPSKCFYSSCLGLVISFISPDYIGLLSVLHVEDALQCKGQQFESPPPHPPAPPTLGGEEAGSITFAHAADILDSTC